MGGSRLINGLFRRRRAPGVVGIEFSAEGVAFARVSSGELQCCDYILYKPAEGSQPYKPAEETGADNRLALLRERIAAHSLVNSVCNIVLPPGSYQLLLMEAPKVPQDELREAVRWKVKELIRFPVEEAVVDAFPLPDDSRRMGGAMVYVVAVKRDVVEEVLSLTEGAGLKVESIDIAEMALRNLAELNSDHSRGVAVVRLRQGAGNLALIRQGNLYLSRQFELDYNAGLLDALPEESLVLELQRSFDYYERQMGQAPPSNIYVCGENVSADKITQGIRTNLAARVSLLAPDEFLAQGAACAEPILQLCVGAIGGALRRRAARA